MISHPFRAFSTLELMIALMILTTTFSAVVLITLELPYAIQNGHIEELATSRAQALLNQSFAMGPASFNAIISIPTTSPSDGFKTSLNVQIMPDNLTKYLYSAVSWNDSRGKTRYTKLEGIVTDYTHAQANTCSVVDSGDWAHPHVLSLNIFDYPVSIVAVDSSGNSSLLVTAATSSGVSTDPDIQLFDISSTSNPIKLGRIDTATSTKIGLSALAVYNKIIYAANFFPANYTTCTKSPTCSQLQIIDATHPATPTILSNFQLATTTAPYATGSGGQSVGKSIFYANGYVYLGLQKAPTASSSPLGEEFNIIDVRDPKVPKWVGGYSIGRTINQIQVLNGYAYLATDDPSRELVILDVHNPNSIAFVSSYDAPGSSTFGYGETVSVSSTTISLGRSYTTTGQVLTFLNSTNLTQLKVTGTNVLSDPLNTTSVREVLIRGFLAFVLTSANLQIWNIQNQSQPILYGSPVTFAVGASAALNALACKQNTIYVISEASHAVTSFLQIITSS
jgi:hypothetical protein